MGQATDAQGLLELGKGIAAANAEKLLEVGLTEAEVSNPPATSHLLSIRSSLRTDHVCSL